MGLFYLLTVGGGELGDLCPLKSTEVTSSLASHGSWGLTEEVRKGALVAGIPVQMMESGQSISFGLALAFSPF